MDVVHYYGSGQYERDVISAFSASKKLLDRFPNPPIGSRVYVGFDIDDTVLCTAGHSMTGIPRLHPNKVPPRFEQSVEGFLPSVPGALVFYQHVMTKGFTPIFVTARRETPEGRDFTHVNLQREGFTGYGGLVMRDDTQVSNESYKQDAIMRLQHQHGPMVLFLGDQESDCLAARKNGIPCTKIPNALYTF
jgi:predicted secreted acid phosphatase